MAPDLPVLIIDDHPLFRAVVATVAQRVAAGVRTIERSTCKEGLTWLGDHPDPAMIVLDLDLPGVDGRVGLSLLREASPATPVVVISASEDTTMVKQALAGGALGYVPKSSGRDVILDALRLVLAGGVYLPPGATAPAPAPATPEAASDDPRLTPRQLEVLELLCQGASNKTIAAQLDVAENTVRVHVSAILKLLGVRNRTQASYQASRLGLIDG